MPGRGLVSTVLAAGEESVLEAYGLGGFPFPLAVAALFLIVLLRAQGTYWLGRAVAAGVRTNARARAWNEGATAVRGIALIHRWGPPVVTFSFLTIGMQTVVNAAAGLVRMPWLRYTLWMIPGCVAWAFIYATVGLAALLALAAAAAGSGWGIAVVVAVVVVAGTLVTLRVRRRRRAALRAYSEESASL